VVGGGTEKTVVVAPGVLWNFFFHSQNAKLRKTSSGQKKKRTGVGTDQEERKDRGNSHGTKR